MIHNNKKIILITVTLVIVIAVFIFFRKGDIDGVGRTSSESQEKSAVDTLYGTPEIIAVQKKINERTDLTPYEKQLELVKVLPLTKADIEEPLWKGSRERFKVFKIKITPDGYVPDAIIVEKGDSIQLNVFSEKDTDIESADFRLFSFVPANTITNLGFLLNQEGTFAFYCKNQCLGAERIFGHVVVRPRS